MYQIEGGRNLKKFLLKCLEDNFSVIISGPPGVGKSEIVAQACNEIGLPYHEIRLYLMEPGEAKGLPDIDRESRRTFWTRPDWLPEEREVVLVADDIHLATEQLQSPLFELLLCRRLHGHTVSEGTRFVAIGNLSLQSAGANEILAPIMDRFDFGLEFRPTPEDFAEYAHSQGVDSKVIAFVLSHPEYLFTSEPPTSRKFASPRSWFSLSRALQRGFPKDVAIGVVGEEAGSRFIDAWPILGLGPKDLLRHKPQSAKDQVVIASALARYTPDEEILAFVERELHEDAQFCYFKSLYIFHRDAMIKLLREQNRLVTELSRKILDILEGKED